MRRFKLVMKIFFIALGIILLAVISYVIYIIASYDRIGDKELNVEGRSNELTANIDNTFNIATYNIGFGAYSQDYTFFLDEGYDDNGNKTCGKSSVAKNKKEVLINTNGAIQLLSDLALDFVFLQEVDTDSTRSHHVNQSKMISEGFSSYDTVFCKNFHSPFLPYPIFEMTGIANSGLKTLSKYQIDSSSRYEFTVTKSLAKFFDLDRCFSVSIVLTSNNKSLYLVNVHASAYDKGGKIREKQMKELNEFLTEASKNDNYVIVGGDFNHDLLTNNPDFTYNETHKPFNNTKKDPDWMAKFFDENGVSPLHSSFRVIASDNSPSVRNNDIEWEEGKTYTNVVDGFMVSNNIQVISHYNIKSKNGNKGVDGFAFSDHEPAFMSFKLLS